MRKSTSRRVSHEALFTIDYRAKDRGRGDLLRIDSQKILIEDDKIREVPGHEATQPVLLEPGISIRRRVSNEGSFDRDPLFGQPAAGIGAIDGLPKYGRR